ncbi:feruloyl-CoA synthase [Tropicibacter naphthalenivorans]|uniref:Long-chain-fatty-acid--CoA ligase n=1 Tax=Tropicibacter naphthalenivorans TaxID=441103 RepID=A0A0P1G2N8_9RHOB|nr:feruloyl-CoA synthase [Tropicibacter naphthalenivorans]CUH75968.1 Long-chain-fatty-acid--CoA ligase [Tropicibacter naphthalenivorans]SMC40922.1 trans-feruloyl-CoA synthase [Tropicibacter naphthalenivorans]
MDTVRFWTPSVRQETRADGSILVWQDEPVAEWPRAMTERLLHWAEVTPDAVWIAERQGEGWAEITYAQAAAAVQSIGSALLQHGLSAERPLLILSGNSVAHALMALGAQHVGVPSAALAPAYTLSGGEYTKLRDIADQLTPGMIFADKADKFAPGINAVFGADVPVVSVSGSVEGRQTLSFDALRETPHTDAMQAAYHAITGETVAKFLFTSGTTGSPKAVIQTQAMICSNQQIVRQCFAFMQDTPPVVCDWAPWNHTASGNKVFNMVLMNGGSYYIDDGKPTPGGIGRTIENLHSVQPTWYFNVPLGYQMLLDAFETDKPLRDNFFSKMQMLMYAGAGMPQSVWDRLTRVAEQAREGGVLVTTGFGATETGPFCLMCTERQETSGNLGIPAHGVTLKLVPQGDKLEARVKSPSITPGYWRNPNLSAEAFDEEGFYCFGDALKFAVEGDASKGFVFDGRLAENFKLASGTWVAVGPLRARLTDDLGGLASDAVIAGEGHQELGALITPNWTRLREIAGADLDGEALLADEKVRHATAEALHRHAEAATGSATRIKRVIYLAAPLDFDKGEVTDKGSINQRAVLRHRADLVDSLWSDDPRVIELGTE